MASSVWFLHNALSLYLGPRTATVMGGHDMIRFGFVREEPEFGTLRPVLGLIACGCEAQLMDLA